MAFLQIIWDDFKKISIFLSYFYYILYPNCIIFFTLIVLYFYRICIIFFTLIVLYLYYIFYPNCIIFFTLFVPYFPYPPICGICRSSAVWRSNDKIDQNRSSS